MYPISLTSGIRRPASGILVKSMKNTNGYRLSTSARKGDAVYATRPFRENEIVMIGAIQKDNVEKNHSHASQIGETRFIMHAGLISKVNHSCMPNCGIRLNADGAHDFVAMRRIENGEEITFDYAMRNYRVDYFPAKCRCGSPGCRGSITGWRDLPDSRKAAYEGYVAPYLLEIDARLSLK